ncbi:glycoside hydrolase family 73 protein, partial [Oenococcus sp.]|uniref:glycoside hydrolase family 73 protein n=1 Tax=Oenococcus sp. TaxID=1979414 RepID=UPI0039EBDE95
SVTYANGQHNDHVLEQDLQTSQLLVNSAGVSSTQRQWLYSIVNDAVTAANANDLYASIMLAQATLETGWGGSMLALFNNNLFGIKENGSPYASGSVTYKTGEYIDGTISNVDGTFNTYESIEDCFLDYVRMLMNNTYYANVFRSKASNYIEAAHNIQNDGYATDPDYATKIINIIQRNNLNFLDGD